MEGDGQVGSADVRIAPVPFYKIVNLCTGAINILLHMPLLFISIKKYS